MIKFALIFVFIFFVLFIAFIVREDLKKCLCAIIALILLLIMIPFAFIGSISAMVQNFLARSISEILQKGRKTNDQ